MDKLREFQTGVYDVTTPTGDHIKVLIVHSSDPTLKMELEEGWYFSYETDKTACTGPFSDPMKLMAAVSAELLESHLQSKKH